MFGIALLFAILSVKRELTALEKCTQKLLDHILITPYFYRLNYLIFIIYMYLNYFICVGRSLSLQQACSTIEK